MELLGLREKSKKTSEAGVWIDDNDVKECHVCKCKFTLIIRRHHCRQCGSVVCGRCSSHRKFLESSRSGAPKRVCSICFAKDSTNNYHSDSTDDEIESQAVSSTGSRNSTLLKLPDIEPEISLKALSSNPLIGRWKLLFTFMVVDIGTTRGADSAGLNSIGAFKGSAAVSLKSSNNTVRNGSRIRTFASLESTRDRQVQGQIATFHIFGTNGEVKGSITDGVLSLTIHIKNPSTNVTTSFELTGLMNEVGEVHGRFTASNAPSTEKAANYSGFFVASRASEEATDENVSKSSSHDPDSSSH